MSYWAMSDLTFLVIQGYVIINYFWVLDVGYLNYTS
jgi:hypothetical protein